MQWTIKTTDEIEVFEDWAWPTGITIGGVEVTIIGDSKVRELIGACQVLLAKREEAYREADDDESATGPELAGFEPVYVTHGEVA